MKTKRRWLTSILAEAAKSTTRMTWARGEPRARMIEQRLAAPVHKVVGRA